MKKLISLILFLGLCAGAFAQYPVTDAFSGAGPIGLGSNWTAINSGTTFTSTLQKNAGVISATGGSGGDPIGVAIYTGQTFGNDQYAQFVKGPDNTYNSHSSPTVRTQPVTGNGYSWYWDLSAIQTWTAGSASTLTMTVACPNTLNYGDTLRIAAMGSTIFCIDMTSGQFGYTTDTTYPTGSPGVMIGTYAGHSQMSGPYQADCFPYSCNSAKATPYSALYPYSPVVDYYSPSSVTVTLTPQAAGWTQCYTTDGSTPTATTPGTCSHGTTYSSSFAISALGLTTVKTIATKSGQVNSAENDYIYNIGYQVPVLNGVQMFPANSIFNAPINTLPVQTTYNTAFQGTYSGTNLFHDFYSGAVGGGSGGIPWNSATTSTPTYTPTFTISGESDAGPYSILANTAIENEATPGCQNTSASPGPDYHNLTVVNTGGGTGSLQEIYQASCISGVWTGYSGAIWNPASNALRTDTWTSADAAGLPVTPFLVKYDEAITGVIQHPMRFTTHITGDTYVWPARHQAGSGGVVPIGVRLRLKASFNISTFSPMNQVILKALQTYGMFLADNGNNGYFQGASDPRWNTDLDLLNAIPFSNFEVVDESGLMLNVNSQQVASGTTHKQMWHGNSVQ